MARRRVNGPYRHGNKFRLVLVGEDGTQVVEAFGTEDAARQEKQRLEREIEAHEGVQVIAAIAAYERYQLEVKKNKARSVETTIGRLKRFFGADVDRPVHRFTEATCSAIYSKLQAGAVDTHRNTLTETKTFFSWCMAKPRRWLQRNPLADIKGEGKRRKGKPQLRVDECTRFTRKAHELAAAGDVDGTISLSALYFGARISEILDRPVRDLDAGGTLFWIPISKTPDGERFLEVPDDLAPLLLQLAAGKGSDDLLFGGINRHQAHRSVKRVCKLAGVPPVGPHGLRGTHATLAREKGITPRLVAQALGHGSYDAVTGQHYTKAGTDERARQREAMRLLQGGKK